MEESSEKTRTEEEIKEPKGENNNLNVHTEHKGDTLNPKKFNVYRFLKKYGPWLVLIGILVFAFYLRAYHLDYPVVGYHNWKEVHYLAEARNFARDGFFRYGFLIPVLDSPHLDENLQGAHTDTFPTTSIIVGFFFLIFGSKLAIARTIDILFVLGAIVFIYLIMKQLFKRQDLALLTALITAFNPLLVFFGRQTMLINPALFFLTASIYFYLEWRSNPKMSYVILFSISFSLSILTQYSFAFIFIPILLSFPLKRFLEKKYWKQYLVGIIFLLPIPIWWYYTKWIGKVFNTLPADIQYHVGVIFQSQFWSTLKAFAADNYTLTGLFFVAVGLIFTILFFKKSFGNKFVLFYFVGAIAWFFILSFKLSGHNYHQYPIAPLFIILIAYSFMVIATNAEKIIRIKHSRWAVLAVLVLILWFPSVEAKDRMFDTQFVGLDVAGEYIKANSVTNERIFFPSHQSYGVLWHSERKGYKLPYDDLAMFKDGEDKNATWVFAYQWGMDLFSHPVVWDYVQAHYSLKQFAYLESSEGPKAVYFLFEKGGNFSMDNLNNLLNGKPTQYKDYEFSKNRIQRMFYINV